MTAWREPYRPQTARLAAPKPGAILAADQRLRGLIHYCGPPCPGFAARPSAPLGAEPILRHLASLDRRPHREQPAVLGHRTSQRKTSMSRFARRADPLPRAVGRLDQQFQHVDARSASRWPNTNRWFFGKLSTRSRNHFTTSYHFTRTTGDSAAIGHSLSQGCVYSPFFKIRAEQARRRVPLLTDAFPNLKGKRDKG